MTFQAGLPHHLQSASDWSAEAADHAIRSLHINKDVTFFSELICRGVAVNLHPLVLLHELTLRKLHKLQQLSRTLVYPRSDTARLWELNWSVRLKHIGAAAHLASYLFGLILFICLMRKLEGVSEGRTKAEWALVLSTSTALIRSLITRGSWIPGENRGGSEMWRRWWSSVVFYKNNPPLPPPDSNSIKNTLYLADTFIWSD